MGTSSVSLSETCLFLLWPLLVTTVTGTSVAVGKEQGYELKLGQVARHLMMVECLQFPWKQLPMLVTKLDFAVS